MSQKLRTIEFFSVWCVFQPLELESSNDHCIKWSLLFLVHFNFCFVTKFQNCGSEHDHGHTHGKVCQLGTLGFLENLHKIYLNILNPWILFKLMIEKQVLWLHGIILKDRMFKYAFRYIFKDANTRKYVS
jgi:hypothetical protein